MGSGAKYRFTAAEYTTTNNMIEIKDVMVGNYVYDENGKIIIIGIIDLPILYLENKHKPIPIKDVNLKTPKGECVWNDGLKKITFDGCINVRLTNVSPTYFNTVEVRFVHQFQNLWRVLYDEELIIG